MAERNEESMVLRTVYLPVQDDETLRGLAFRLKRSKGDLIREFIRSGLERRQQEAAGSAHVVAETLATLKAIEQAQQEKSAASVKSPGKAVRSIRMRRAKLTGTGQSRALVVRTKK